MSTFAFPLPQIDPARPLDSIVRQLQRLLPIGVGAITGSDASRLERSQWAGVYVGEQCIELAEGLNPERVVGQLEDVKRMADLLPAAVGVYVLEQCCVIVDELEARCTAIEAAPIAITSRRGRALERSAT